MNTYTFNLHFTDYCNFHCKHCFVKKEGKELSLDKIKIIADKLADFQTKNHIKIRVNLAGGEPLLSKNIQSIIDYLNEVGLEVSIITNGYYLTYDFINNNQNKLSMIGISVDSLNYKTNELIGRIDNGKTLDKETLLYYCKVIQNCGIKLKINTCITSLNLSEDINELIKEVEPDRFKVLRALCDSTTEQFNITDKEWEKVKSRYTNAFFEDNEYMRTSYMIIDSEGNLSRNNLHFTDNSLIDRSLIECLETIAEMGVRVC